VEAREGWDATSELSSLLIRSYVVVSLGRLPVAARVMVAAEYVGVVLEVVYEAASTTLWSRTVTWQRLRRCRMCRTKWLKKNVLIALWLRDTQLEAYEALSNRVIDFRSVPRFLYILSCKSYVRVSTHRRCPLGAVEWTREARSARAAEVCLFWRM